jgi:WD40 repeat protein
MSEQELETILFFAANPSDRAPLRLDFEIREIQSGLRHSRKRFDVRYQAATRPTDLRRALLDHTPAYVHFSGHGAGTAGIVLEDQIVGAEALAGLFALCADTLKCVVLNACYTSIQAHAIVQHIDYVVGMTKAIGDVAAIEFSTAFYDALGAGKSVEVAFEFGCNAIQLAGIPEHLTPQLLTRENKQVHPHIAVPSAMQRSIHGDWDGAPAVSQLFGREADAELLRSWILNESCRVVLITGLGGIGKTDLATCLGRGGNRSEGTSATLAGGIHGAFDTVIWRSLRNAPPPDDLFGDLVEFLSEQRRSARTSEHQQIEDVVRCLQERRCLVIIDNVEAVLRPGDPTIRYREGYEPYGVFFEQVAKTGHQSCLLLTSREKPRAIADLEGAHRPVRSFSLSGIGTAECRALFEQIGEFSGTSEAWDRIVRLYNGNPLALELVARHVLLVFSGDLGAFLQMGRSTFSDLAQLLDWHLDRLSPEETELVYWFAIEREPVSIATLADGFVSLGSRANLTSTIQSLQRRLPLERSGNGGFTLQPVLIEHVTARLVHEVASGLESALNELRSAATTADVALKAVHALLPFNTYPLIKATSRENVREAQRRLILAPVAERLASVHAGEAKGAAMALLEVWRQLRPGEPGYVAGNVINLLSTLDVSLARLDVSEIPVWQACLHDVDLHGADFSSCAFRNSTFRHPFGTVFSLCYSPDGASIAVGDDNGEVRIFSTANGQFEMRCVGHSDSVASVAYSPDGQVIASSSYDNTIRLWNARDGRCVDLLLGHRAWVYAIAFSPDGQSLASASEDGTCRVWDLRSGKSVSAVTDEVGFIAAVAFSPDGRMLAVAGSSRVVSLFDLSDLRKPIRLERHEARVRTLAFSADGEMLASGAEDSEIHLWRPRDGSYIGTLRGHSQGIASLSFSSAGDILASGSSDHTVRLWSTASLECVSQLRVAPSRVWEVRCSPTDRTLTTGSEDGAVRVWNMDTCECLMTLRGHSNKTWSLAFSPYRSLLFAANEDSLVRAWNIPEARTDLELSGHATRVWAVACSVDGQWVASASDDGSVRLWDLGTRECVHVLLGHTDWIRAVAFHPTGRTLASAGEDGRVMIWDVAKGSLRGRVETGMPRVFAVAFCDYGSCVAAGGAGNMIELFASADSTRIGGLTGHDGVVTALVPLDMAGLLASCSEDGTVKIWDVSRRECIRTLEVGAKVMCGSFYGQDASFISGEEDGTLRRWLMATGECIAQVRAHQGAIWSLAMSPTEDIVATAGNDGTIRLWSMPEMTPILGPLRPPRPYDGMNISGATGLTSSQREALLALGAVILPSP